MKQETMSVGAKIEREASVMPLCSARSLLEIRAEIEDKIGRSGSGLVVGVSDLSFNSGANGEYWHVPAKTREGKFGALVLYRCDGGVEILNE
ncbi:hypothetical protein [Zoogloea sp.]|uniref:hypothetical protein n=1 Tax=Zoogloea sp. TaxID=49181 RepID=UPI0014160956|nr:MAG: hypothetical protein F9K15_10710 [Zoogloea sp.]